MKVSIRKDNTEQMRDAQKALRKRRRDAGWKLVQYWVHEADEYELLTEALRLQENRGGLD